jgi:uncharacterized RDD family membrane protein YckC
VSDYPPPPPPPFPPPPPEQPPWGGAPGQQVWGPPAGQQGWSPPGQWAPPAQGWGAPGGRRFAGFGARLAASIIDGLVLSPFAIGGRIVLATGPKRTTTCSFDASLTCTVPAGKAWGLAFLFSVAGRVAAILYYGLLEGRTAQTLGKRALSIRVVDAYTGAPIGVGRAIGRYFGRIVSAIPCFLGYFWMLWDPNKQAWHDKMVGSYVVSD